MLALSTFLLYRSVWAISFSYLALLERLFLDSCVLLDRLGLDGGHRVAGLVRGYGVGGGGGVGSPSFAAGQDYCAGEQDYQKYFLHTMDYYSVQNGPKCSQNYYFFWIVFGNFGLTVVHFL